MRRLLGILSVSADVIIIELLDKNLKNGTFSDPHNRNLCIEAVKVSKVAKAASSLTKDIDDEKRVWSISRQLCKISPTKIKGIDKYDSIGSVQI